MQLADVPGFSISFESHTYAMFCCPTANLLLGFFAVSLTDDHLATIALASIQVASSGGIVLSWRNYLEEIVTHRHQGVFQAEGGDSRVDETGVYSEYFGQICQRRFQFLSDQTDLP
jgi:hypothetical protein